MMSADTIDLYPPSIENPPPDLTAPTSAYRRQVVLVLVCLALFLALYFGLVIGTAYYVVATILFYSSASTDSGNPVQDGGSNIFIAVFCFIVFIFLVKAFFKRGRRWGDTHIEVTEAEEPVLFDFIRRVCEDCKAPFPRHIYLSDDVNAGVFYNNSVLSLFLPVRKNLVIGLGLVNHLNLCELKAVLAHEFGHFSQNTMRLGSYVYVSNKVIYDLVYHRDGFDQVIERAKHIEIRIAIFAYIVGALIWVIRKILEVAFRVINFYDRALSRQMEFNADLVAVSVTGSDALIHGLKKSEFASEVQAHTSADLSHAADNQLCSADIYFHQAPTAVRLREQNNKPEAGTLPILPDDPAKVIYLFEEEKESADERKWSSHPSHFDRERNAKKQYLRSPVDERSCWLLFKDPAETRRKVSEKHYKNRLPHAFSLTEPGEVQRFIDGEHEQMVIDPRYLGLFDNRRLVIEPDEFDANVSDEKLDTMPVGMAVEVARFLYGRGYSGWVKEFDNHITLSRAVNEVAELKGKHLETKLEIEGTSYTVRQLQAMKDQVRETISKDIERLSVLDADMIRAHLVLARSTGKGFDELLIRYRFHMAVLRIIYTCDYVEDAMDSVGAIMSKSSSGQLKQEDFKQIQMHLAKAHKVTGDELKIAAGVSAPAMNNVQGGVSLCSLVVRGELVKPLPASNSISGEWLGSFSRQMSQIEARASRLHAKSIGAILALQESIAEASVPGILDEPGAGGAAEDSG